MKPATKEEIRIGKVLAEIQSRVPSAWRESVAEEVDATPTIKMVMEKALEDDKVRPDLKEKIKTLLDAGEFSKKKVREVTKFTTLIDRFITREINKAIKEGKLPKKYEQKDYTKGN